MGRLKSGMLTRSQSAPNLVRDGGKYAYRQDKSVFLTENAESVNDSISGSYFTCMEGESSEYENDSSCHLSHDENKHVEETSEPSSEDISIHTGIYSDMQEESPVLLLDTQKKSNMKRAGTDQKFELEICSGKIDQGIILLNSNHESDFKKSSLAIISKFDSNSEHYEEIKSENEASCEREDSIGKDTRFLAAKGPKINDESSMIGKHSKNCCELSEEQEKSLSVFSIKKLEESESNVKRKLIVNHDIDCISESPSQISDRCSKEMTIHTYKKSQKTPFHKMIKKMSKSKLDSPNISDQNLDESQLEQSKKKKSFFKKKYSKLSSTVRELHENVSSSIQLFNFSEKIHFKSGQFNVFRPISLLQLNKWHQKEEKPEKIKKRLSYSVCGKFTPTEIHELPKTEKDSKQIDHLSEKTGFRSISESRKKSERCSVACIDIIKQAENEIITKSEAQKKNEDVEFLENGCPVKPPRTFKYDQLLEEQRKNE